MDFEALLEGLVLVVGLGGGEMLGVVGVGYSVNSCGGLRAWL